MKFGYAYKSSDGIRHEAVFEAKTKEEVFASLRTSGVRPIKVWEIRSRFFFLRKNLAIFALFFFSIASCWYAVNIRHKIHRSAASIERQVRTAPRHQIYGDPAIWDEIERDNFSSVFNSEGDRILASFAIPGRETSILTTMTHDAAVLELEKCKDDEIPYVENDGREVEELKCIVRGMKEELGWYLADGVGTVSSYLHRLSERQQEELRIYLRTVKELEGCDDNVLREERNAALRAMGLRTIPRKRKNGR